MNNNLILLVEDDRRLADLVKDFLETNDFAVVVEAHGNRVIRQCQNVNPALIILDLLLKGMDAETFIGSARATGYEGPILLCTAITGDPPIVADGVLKKPFRPEDLIEKVQELTNHK